MSADRVGDETLYENYALVRKKLQESLESQRPNTYFRRALKLRLSNAQQKRQAQEAQARRILWLALGLTAAISLGVGISLWRKRTARSGSK